MKKAVLSAAVALAAAVPSQAAVLYQNDFDNPVVVAGGVGVSSLANGFTQSATTFGNWSGTIFRNDSGGNPAALSQLTLSNLPGHSSIVVNFVIGLLDSWDSTNGSPSPDLLDIFIDGNLVAQLTYNQASGSVQQLAGGTLVTAGVQATAPSFFSDTIIDMGTASALNFAHTASTLTVGIRASGAGWQGGGDESWGIDAIDISYVPAGGTAVPAPAAMGLLVGAGLLGAALKRRRA